MRGPVWLGNLNHKTTTEDGFNTIGVLNGSRNPVNEKIGYVPEYSTRNPYTRRS